MRQMTLTSGLLPHLANAAREARVAAGLTYAHIAVHVRKDEDRVGVSDSTVARFEYGQHWPINPDAMIAAYARALGVAEQEIWGTAVDAAKRPRRRRKRPEPEATASGQIG
jgi:transcriptional regulator with XRE-family HTH domain